MTTKPGRRKTETIDLMSALDYVAEKHFAGQGRHDRETAPSKVWNLLTEYYIFSNGTFVFIPFNELAVEGDHFEAGEVDDDVFEFFQKMTEEFDLAGPNGDVLWEVFW